MSELLIEISKLSIAHRLELAQAILRSIALEHADNAQSTTLSSRQQVAVDENDKEAVGELSQAQINTLLLRRDEVLSGKVKTIPAEEVNTKLAAKYGLQN